MDGGGRASPGGRRAADAGPGGGVGRRSRGTGGFDADIDPEIAEEVQLQEETREADGDEDPVETVLNFRDEEDEEE